MKYGEVESLLEESQERVRVVGRPTVWGVREWLDVDCYLVHI